MSNIVSNFNKKPLYLILLFLLLAACTSSQPQAIEVTRIVPQTVIVSEVVTQVITEFVEVIVTVTPKPPTSTPVQTPTPEYQKWLSTDVLELFKATGLEAEKTHSMTKDDYGIAPMTAIEGTRFYIPSLCADCGGRIFSFSSPEDLETLKNYYLELAKSSALFFSWVFEKDNILVQINGDLSEEKAKFYEQALSEME